MAKKVCKYKSATTCGYIENSLNPCPDCPFRTVEPVVEESPSAQATALAKALTPLLHQGPRGEPGDSIKGDTGAKGDSIKGDKGATILGPVGLTGPPGRSIQGPPGPPGKSIKGDKGEPGEVDEDHLKKLIKELLGRLQRGPELLLGWGSRGAVHDAVTIGADAAHSLATQVLSGVTAASGQLGHMTGAMVDKLAGIAAGADVTADNAPKAHKTSHQNAGTDEIDVGGLSGELADNQPPKAHDYDIHTGGVPYDELEYDDATSDPLVDGAAAADGTETSAARKDHVHPRHHANVFSYGITVEAPTNAEDISVAFTNRAITVTEMRAVLIGTSNGQTVTWTVRHHASDRNNAGNEVVTGGTATTSLTTGSDVTAFNDATIPADSFIWLETTAKGGTVTELHITIIGTID